MLNAINNHSGIYSRTVFNNYQRGAVPAVSAVKKLDSEVVQNTSAATQHLNKEMTDFLSDYREQFSDLKNAADQLSVSADKNIWNQTRAQVMNSDIAAETAATNISGNISTDLQTVRSSVENLVEAYNHTVQFMNENSMKNNSTPSQLQNLLLPGISDQAMESIGLTYADDGTLNFQSDVFDESYHQNGKQVQELLGGKHNIADRLRDTCERALKQPSNSFIQENQIKWDLKNLQNQQRNNGETLPMGVYSRNGSYNIMNAAAMGMFLNVKA